MIPTWLDAFIAFLLIAGAFFTLVGAWGLAKFSTFMKRIHGPTKATTLGIGCVLIASMAWFIARGTPPVGHELLITLFLFLTPPVSAQLLVKAAMISDPSARPPPPPQDEETL